MRAFVVILSLAPSLALAQPAPPTPTPTPTQGVALIDPDCASLPFATERVRALISLELEVEELALVAPEHAAWVLAYAPTPCEPGATRYRLEVRGAGRARAEEAALDAVPLATVPRALALQLVEMLRVDDGDVAAEETEASVEVASIASERASVATERAPSERAPDPPPPPAPRPAPSASPPLRLAIGAHLRNTPDTGAILAGPRVLLDLGLGHDLPLSVRFDVTAAFGGAPHELVLGAVDAGVAVFLWARAAPELALRFGPRLFVGHDFLIEGDATRLSGDVQVGVGVRVGAELRLVPGIDLLVEAEVGTHLVDLALETGGGPSGLAGAYWGADLALGFEL